MTNPVNTPLTDKEVDEFIANLTDDDKKELRRQQLVNAAVQRKPDVAPNLNNDDEYLKAVRDMPWTTNG